MLGYRYRDYVCFLSGCLLRDVMYTVQVYTFDMFVQQMGDD